MPIRPAWPSRLCCSALTVAFAESDPQAQHAGDAGRLIARAFGGRQIVFEAGPHYGGGNMFLYDIAKERIVEMCIQRAEGAVCPDWGKIAPRRSQKGAATAGVSRRLVRVVIGCLPSPQPPQDLR